MCVCGERERERGGIFKPICDYTVCVCVCARGMRLGQLPQDVEDGAETVQTVQIPLPFFPAPTPKSKYREFHEI